MLVPRKVKFRKQHHPKRTGLAKGGTKVVTSPTARSSPRVSL
jgi:ribosomal protein L16/L10AE